MGDAVLSSRCDVVVGAGSLAGLACSVEPARSGVDVCLLKASGPCWRRCCPARA